MATRDQILISMGMELPKDQIYERHKIRVPQEGEDTIKQSVVESPSFFGKQPIKAKVDAKNIPTSNDRLADAVMESLTGVSAEWLAPARPAFAKVLMAAQDPNKSDKEVIEAMEELSNSMPELFDSINHDALANALEEAMGSAAALSLIHI